MKSIDMLREFADTCPSFDNAQRLKKLADKIEDEIANRYLKKPLDMDGRVIDIGDELEYSNEMFEVAWIEYERFGVTVGEVYNCGGIPIALDPSECRHVMPDAVKKLLEEFAKSGTSTGNGGVLFETGLIEEYAAKIRRAVLL